MTVLLTKPKQEELTSKGFTNRIKIAPGQTRASLLNYGFTNYNPATLYFMRMVGSNVSLNISLNVTTLAIEKIDVLDENFLQPFDYQQMILSGRKTKKAVDVYKEVNSWFSKLQEDGIIEGFTEGMYI